MHANNTTHGIKQHVCELQPSITSVGQVGYLAVQVLHLLHVLLVNARCVAMYETSYISEQCSSQKMFARVPRHKNYNTVKLTKAVVPKRRTADQACCTHQVQDQDTTNYNTA